MGATQFEINYENALKAKDIAQGVYNKSNNDYLTNKKRTTDFKIERDHYHDCMIDNSNFLFDDRQTNCGSIKDVVPIGQGGIYFNAVWSKNPMYTNGVQARNNYNDALSKDSGLKETSEQARVAYQESEITAKKAYDDWMEWKVSNMTASELKDFQDLEQSGELFGLKLKVWQWIAIGAGVLVFFFAAWWILRKFKVKIPTITVPKAA